MEKSLKTLYYQQDVINSEALESLLTNNVTDTIQLVGYNTSTYAIGLGHQAGQTLQDLDCIAIGRSAGQYSQQNASIAIGYSAGQTYQGSGSIALGQGSGFEGQGNYCIAIGSGAGESLQGNQSIAIGSSAGLENMGENCIAIGNNAGASSQQANSIAIGNVAGSTNMGENSIAIGNNAGILDQHDRSIILNASGTTVNSDDVDRFYVKPIRSSSDVINGILCYNNTNFEISYNPLALPASEIVGLTDTQILTNKTFVAPVLGAATATSVNNLRLKSVNGNSIYIGEDANHEADGLGIGIGYQSAYSDQADLCIAMGVESGLTSQGSIASLEGFDNAIAIGYRAGRQSMAGGSICIGRDSGKEYCGNNNVFVGDFSGTTTSHTNSVGIGYNSANINCDNKVTAVGAYSAYTDAGSSSVNVGYGAGYASSPANSIVLNASGSNFSPATSSACYINPVRNNDTVSNKLVQYNTSTKELSYNTLSLPSSTIIGLTDVQTMTNKRFSDSTTFFVDEGDNTKKFAVQLSGISALNTRTMTIPDFDFTPASLSGSEALSNKTITSSTYSGTSILNNGSGMTLTSGSNNFLLPNNSLGVVVFRDDTCTLTNKSLQDSTTFIVDNGDATKKCQFQCSGITTGNTRTITIPDTDLVMSGRAVTETLTNKTITHPIITSEATPTPSEGMMYYDSTAHLMRYYDGTLWRYMGYTPTLVARYHVGSATNNTINSSVAAVSPWSASGNITYATNSDDSFSALYVSAHGNGDYIQLSFGSQPAGVYQLFASFLQFSNMGTIVVSETTTGTTLQTIDLYQPGVNGTSVTYIRSSFTFPTTGTLQIKFLTSGHNASASDYYINLNNSVELLRIG